MRFFDPRAGSRSPDHERVYAAYEQAHTPADFAAAASFVVGSVMFFFEAWQTPGTWLFLVGSLPFAAKPSIRLARELHYLRLGKTGRLARRYGN